MERYILKAQSGKLIKEGSITEVMSEVMKIAQQEGSIPEVIYDNDIKATCFIFEGYYCSFRLYLS